MNLAMHVHGLPGRHHDHLFSLASQRTRAALGRLADQVTGVVLRLHDENGPKGGRARRCVAALQLADGGQLVASDLSTDWGEAVSRAMTRATGMLKRLANRRRSLDRR